MALIMDTGISSKARHPEKIRKENDISPPKPSWIRVRAPSSEGYTKTKAIVEKNKLKTVCQEACCPNIGECWSLGHATFMIMGEICTRGCAFCNVITGKPDALDIFEPARVAQAVKSLGLKHVVITSVDRDDLNDGGAGHFAATIRGVRYQNPETTIEVLTPDFLHRMKYADEIINVHPDVFNHNIETVPSLYPDVRPGARYFHSLRLLQYVKESDTSIFTKSGLMVGLGEDHRQVVQVMDDLRVAGVDFLTIGQYLQPTLKHRRVYDYISPKKFKEYEDIAYAKGFLQVSSSPLTRSSYHADEDFRRLQEAYKNGVG